MRKCRTERPPGVPPIQGGGFGPDITEHVAEAHPHPGYQLVAEKGVASGYASLNASGQVPAGQLPAATLSTAGVIAIGELHGYAAADMFGTGADGNQVVSGTITLTHDWDFENLTVQSGGVLETAGFRVRVLNTLTWNGIISCNGAAASGATPGSGGGAGIYAGGTDGAAGVPQSVGGSSTGTPNNWGALHGPANACRGGSGGGSGAGQPGGNGGATTAPPDNAGREHGNTWQTGYLHGESIVRLKPGTGGGSGGASAGSTSGAGGGGGGVCAVFARRIGGSGGTHAAVGGKGGIAPGGNAGGGGGGGGGIVICRYVELLAGATLPTVTVAGGDGGAGVGSGNAGNAGNAGFASVRRLVRS